MDVSSVATISNLLSIKKMLIFVLLWILFVSPIKSVVKQKVGADKYRQIIKIYKGMILERAFGALLIVFSVAGMAGMKTAESYSSVLLIPQKHENLVCFAYLMFAIGVSSYLVGFVKSVVITLSQPRTKDLTTEGVL